MTFWKLCSACKGRGEVLPQSPAARAKPRGTGELADRTKSVCKKCDGTGMLYSTDMEHFPMSPRQWAQAHDQQTRVGR